MSKKAKKSDIAGDLGLALNLEAKLNPALSQPPIFVREARPYEHRHVEPVDEDELSDDESSRKIPKHIKKEEELSDDDEFRRKIPTSTQSALVPVASAAAVDFQKWLGVKSGAYLSHLRETIAKENPKLSSYEVQLESEAMLTKDEKNKKSIHERVMPDEKSAQMLLYAYINNGDNDAIAIYRKFQREQILRECGNDTRMVNARMAAIERTIEMASRRHRLTPTTVELEEGDVSISELKQSAVSTTVLPQESAVDVLQRVRTAQGEVSVPGPLGTVASLLSMYTEDPAMSNEQMRSRHLNDITRRVASAMNITAALIAVAPDNAVFRMKSSSRAHPHPVSAMMAMLDDHGVQVEENDVTEFMKWWTVTQKTSSDDVEQALASTNRRAGLDLVESEMERRGVSREEVRASMNYAVDPFQSVVIRMVSEFVQNEEFRQANEASLLANKMDQRANGKMAKKRDKRDESDTSTNPHAAYDIEIDRRPLTAPYEDTARSLPTLPRAYLAEFMRKGAGDHFGERECANGLKCICLTLSTTQPTLGSNIGGMAAHNVSTGGEYGIGGSLSRELTEPLAARTTGPDPMANSIIGRHQNGFICREFLLPVQQAKFKRNGELPSMRGMCVICLRATVTEIYHRYTQQAGPGEPHMPLEILQNYAVYIDQAEEYPHSACLATTFHERQFTGIVKPYVEFSRNHYVYSSVTVHGQTLPRLVETAILSFRKASVSATRT